MGIPQKNAPRSFIGRFDHYCGKVRALYAVSDGHSQTDWFPTEAQARDAVPDEAVEFAAAVNACGRLGASA